MNNDLMHVGVLGMKWGRRKGSSGSSKSNGGKKGSSKLKSFIKNLDKKAEERTLRSAEAQIKFGKGVVNFLMTPSYSKTKWLDMTPQQKKKTLLVSAAALTVVGAIMYKDLAG